MTFPEMFERSESSRQLLLDAAEKMDSDSFVRRRPGIFSVRDLLAHLMDAEDFWIGSVVLGEKRLKFDPERYPDIKTLRAEWDTIRRRTRKLFANLSEEKLRETRSVRLDEDVTLELPRILWRFLTHEIHHVGQACMLIHEQGFEPPTIGIL